MGTIETLIVIAGLAVITLLTRGAFLLPERDLPLPTWLQRGLRHAPLAALVAIVVPEVVMTDGHLIGHWQDARVFAAIAAAAWFFWRRSVLGTIVVGVAVLTALRLAFGW